MVNTTFNKIGKKLPPVKTGQRFGAEIKKDKNLREQTSTNIDENENSLQNSNKKIKPETMVFKPKISKNEYNQKI